MWDLAKLLVAIIVIFTLFELLEFPSWLGRKLRGDEPKKELEEQVTALEARVAQLEEKIDKDNA